jgi:hypothetical protein
LEYVTSNVMQRYAKLQRVEGETKANRGVFTEAELQAIFATATAFELALFGTLSMTGPRPGWTFVSLARASGEAAFNVSRVIGHARSAIVDTIYAHTVDSALAGVSERVAERIGLTPPTPPAAPDPPRQPPKLCVIEGGRRAEGNDQRDVRRTIEAEDARGRSPRERTSD